MLLDMEHMPCSELIEHMMLCWRDMISDLAILSMPIYSLVGRLEKLWDMMFGFCLENDKSIMGQFAKIREIEHTFELNRKELEHERSKLKNMFHGNSKEMANYLQLER